MAKGVSMMRRGPGSVVTKRVVWLVLLLVVGASGTAQASAALDEWRRVATETRQLAENDAPRAHEQAKRLQSNLPADAMPADRARALNLLARTEAYLGLTSEAAD